MTDQLEKLCRDLLTDLLANNASAIAQELRENPEGKLSVATGLKLRLVGSKLYATGALAYSRKFTDEAEGVVEFTDPRQPGLPLDSVTITTPGEKPVTVTVDKFSNFVKSSGGGSITPSEAKHILRSVVEAHEKET